MLKLLLILLTTAGLSFIGWNYLPSPSSAELTDSDIAVLSSLSLTALPPIPNDPSNVVANNAVAAEFGHSLFFDKRLSGTGTISCATCHQPDLSFTDAKPLAIGTGIGPRHTPSLVGIAYSPWFYWDGRKDSQWAQALAPLEASHEHDIDRLSVSRLVLSDSNYNAIYSDLFGAAPSLPDTAESATPDGSPEQVAAWNQLTQAQQHTINTVYSNIGKALAAYQRKLLPGRSRFDDFADTVSSSTESDFTNTEIAGLKLFLGKAQCVTCHNGPLFTNHEFHNTGVQPNSGELPPMARYDGVRIARNDIFNCLGAYSDAQPRECIELRFALDANDLVGAQKTPTLRNIADTAPYMHGGQLETLTDVISHYNDAPTSMLSHNEAKPLGLRQIELQQLEAFLKSLSAPLATESKWLQAPQD